MTRFVLRLIINAIALYAAVYFVPGITAQNESWISYLWLALIFGIVNALVRPLLMLLTCPLIILTLGLGTLLINTLLFWLAGELGSLWGVGFSVDNFLSAFLGALVTSIVSVLLSVFVREDREARRERKDKR